jgi:hypothetical protein
MAHTYIVSEASFLPYHRRFGGGGLNFHPKPKIEG